MKKYLLLPFIAFLLLTTFVFIGCSAKESAPIPDVAEVPPIQIPEQTDDTSSPDAEMADKSDSPEVDAEDESHSPEAALTEKPQSPEQETHSESEPEETIPTVEIPSGSVLSLIPEDTLGLIYCPSLTDLDNRINILVTDLMPTTDPPQVLSRILADTFGAGFESLAELEEIGLDLSQDFAIFMTSLKPPDLSATVHLMDAEAMKQVIDAESEGSAPTQYNGVTYWSTPNGEGNFAIIENTLVFSESAEVCEIVIDTYKGGKQSIAGNSSYNAFLTDVSEGAAQLAVHFDLESVAPILDAALKEELESTTDSLESDPTAMEMAPLFESMFEAAIDVLNQVESLSATLEVEGTDVQLAPFLKFKNDSKFQHTLKESAPSELALLGKLPNKAFMNGAFQVKPKFIIEMSMFWLNMRAPTASPEQLPLIEGLVKQMENFYGSLGDEWAFAVDFGDNLFLYYLVVCELEDEQKVKTYIEESLLKQLEDSIEIARSMMGNNPALKMYEGVHKAESVMHGEVEIQSFTFPNFGAMLGEMPPEAAVLMPETLNLYYAFADGYIFMASGSPGLIKAALDNRAEAENMPSHFSQDPSYGKLIDAFGLENNLLVAISPILGIKNMLPILARTDPSAASMAQMLSGMIMNMPDNYSISYSAKVQEGGIAGKLLLTLGDFKQLIQMVAMMQGMGQMQ